MISNMEKLKLFDMAKKEEIKITPEKARENYLNSLAKELGDLRDAITDKNKVKEELVEKYGILYKNILLEHYKTLNITFNNNDEQGNKGEIEKTD